jgi:hypothetical protein
MKMIIISMMQTLNRLTTIADIVAFGESMADTGFVFSNCHPQLIFSNGVEQITVWDVKGKPSLQKYNLADFFDAQGRPKIT